MKIKLISVHGCGSDILYFFNFYHSLIQINDDKFNYLNINNKLVIYDKEYLFIPSICKKNIYSIYFFLIIDDFKMKNGE